MELPEVRQNTEEGHWEFGSIAVRMGENEWGVMSPKSGGHYSSNEGVKDWTPLIVQVAPDQAISP